MNKIKSIFMQDLVYVNCCVEYITDLNCEEMTLGACMSNVGCSKNSK